MRESLHLFAHAAGIGKVLKGFIKVFNEEFRIELRFKDEQDMSSAEVYCDWKLKELIKKHLPGLQRVLVESNSLKDFLTHLEETVKTELATDSSNINTLMFDYISLMKDLESVGWQKLTYVSTAFDEVHLCYRDAKDRKHELKVKLHKQHPKGDPTIIHQLPISFDYKWDHNSTLKHLYENFESSVKNLQTFWDVMSDLDSTFVVTEPRLPSLSDNHRRIFIANSLSIQVTVNPCDPLVMPDIKFFGNDQDTIKLKESMHKNYNLWDIRKETSSNMKTILEIEFLEGGTTEDMDAEIECSLCLCHILEDETPDIQCSSKCSCFFHPSCAIKLFRAQPTSRQSYRVLFGTCPNCSQPMEVSL